MRAKEVAMTNQNGTSNLEDNKQVSSHDQDVQTVGMDRTVLNQEEVKKVKSEKKKDSKFSLRELTIIGLPADRESKSLLGEFVYKMGKSLKLTKLISQQLTNSEVSKRLKLPTKSTLSN